MPVEAIGAAMGGPDWSIAMPEGPGGVDALGADAAGAIDGVAGADGAGGGFDGVLTKQLQNLQGLQDDAAQQGAALATGQADDAAAVVMAVEKAQLSMQLAASLRDKGVESFQEIFRTQV